MPNQKGLPQRLITLTAVKTYKHGSLLRLGIEYGSYVQIMIIDPRGQQPCLLPFPELPQYLVHTSMKALKRILMLCARVSLSYWTGVSWRMGLTFLPPYPQCVAVPRVWSWCSTVGWTHGWTSVPSQPARAEKATALMQSCWLFWASYKLIPFSPSR